MDSAVIGSRLPRGFLLLRRAGLAAWTAFLVLFRFGGIDYGERISVDHQWVEGALRVYFRTLRLSEVGGRLA